MTIRVFLLDDHELVREGLRAVLEREGDMQVVGEAGNGPEGLDMIERAGPDVVLVDLMLSGGDGLDVCLDIKRRCPDAACVALAAFSNDEILLSAIRAEVAGFLLKTAAASELVRSVRVVAGGGSLLDPILTGRLVERLRSGRIVNDEAALVAELSPQERRLLDHLAEGLSNRQIAGRMQLAEKTIKNYVSNLLRKLDVRSRTEAAVFVTNLRAERERRSLMVAAQVGSREL